MQFRLFKLRFRRRLRMRKRQVEELGVQAEVSLERNLFRRLSRLQDVRRFVVGWILLCLLLVGCGLAQMQSLSSYYQTVKPVPGGIYTEGILGDFTNANPIYASTEVDSSVSRLVFAGLLMTDSQNHLVGNLADKWSVDDAGTTYTVTLKPNLTWQDGKPLTASDVAFTYKVIQNPDASSPLQSSWQGITVKAVNPRTVTFTLPNALAAFPYGLTNGIVPEHILKNVPMSEMRSVSFNTQNPIGAGPFRWKTVEVSGSTPTTREEQVALVPFEKYSNGGPHLSSFVVHAFHSRDDMLKSFESHQLSGMVGIKDVPASLKNDKTVFIHHYLLTAANMVFFRTTSDVLSDVKVRQALVQAADTPKIVDQLGYPTRFVREPLLQGQLAYDPKYVQASYNPAAAAKALDQAGWPVGKNGIRAKNNLPLKFTLYAADTPENRKTVKTLAANWRHIGAEADVSLLNDSDMQQAQRDHSYDALLNGIAIGPDPDVFAYWDSSQADVRAANRLNFSEYKSTAADQALEAGRTRTASALRVIKYQRFLQAWQQDAPALGLYQPSFTYVTNGKVYGLDDQVLNVDTDRYANVQNWQIHTAAQTNQ